MENRGGLFRKLIGELLGYAKKIEFENFLTTVAVLITHCEKYISKNSKKKKTKNWVLL